MKTGPITGALSPPLVPTLDGGDEALEGHVVRWLSHLRSERRLSPKTLEAYARDVRQFIRFLAEHWNAQVSPQAFATLEASDVRAFMAERRNENIGGRSLMRQLAGLRSFGRFLEREGKGKVGALSAIRAPKIRKSLPKPVPVAAAKRLADSLERAGETSEPWIWARDAAVMALLYGSGLRISEALGLKRRDVPMPGKGDGIFASLRASAREILSRSPASAQHARMAAPIEDRISQLEAGPAGDDLPGLRFLRSADLHDEVAARLQEVAHRVANPVPGPKALAAHLQY